MALNRSKNLKNTVLPALEIQFVVIMPFMFKHSCYTKIHQGNICVCWGHHAPIRRSVEQWLHDSPHCDCVLAGHWKLVKCKARQGNAKRVSRTGETINSLNIYSLGHFRSSCVLARRRHLVADLSTLSCPRISVCAYGLDCVSAR